MNELPETPDSAPEPIVTDTPPSKSRLKLVIAGIAAVAVVSIAAVWFVASNKAGGKPVPAPRSVSFDESPGQMSNNGEQKLTLSSEQLQHAGIKIELVGESFSPEARDQITTGIVQANSYRETPVVSLVGGIVRSVNGELGQFVKRDQQVVMVFSNELAEAQAKYLTAVAALKEHQSHHMRAEKLVEIGAASRQDLELAQSMHAEAESNVANLREKLLLLGLTAERIDELTSASKISSEASVVAPSNGTITSRTVNPGEVIQANKELMRITDLSNVWVVGQVYEKDLARIHVGSGANITSESYPDRTFRGRVTYVDPNIDPATRTAQVRVELPNPGQMFKIGMYVKVGFASLGAGETTMPTIPKNSVQTIGDQLMVFVPTERIGEFVLRPVRLGAENNGTYQVVEGLTVGERIVTEGSFLLRAEWLKVRNNQP